MWNVYEGFQDEFKVIASFNTKKEALKFAKTRPGWGKNDPIHMAVWINKVP